MSRAAASFDDFAVGQTFDSAPYTMELARMVAFATDFDPQPAHLSEALAADSQFGRLVASGWHTSAVAMRLLISDALPPILGGGMGAGVERLMWPRPVYPGDILRVRAEVTGARASRSKPDKGLVNMHVDMTNAAGQTVLTMDTTVMVPRLVA